jgi:hypothetical protein
LEDEIAKIDAAYDNLNEAWTEGEVTGFDNDKLLALELRKAEQILCLYFFAFNTSICKYL